MISWHGKTEPRDSVMLLGQFDGVHLGHQALIQQAISEARANNLLAAALLFDPLPRALLADDFQPLQSHQERLATMLAFGLDGIYICKTDKNFLKTSPTKFIAQLQQMQAATIVVGQDFRFGHKRAGDLNLLRQHFNVLALPDIVNADRRISSSWCRELILAGDVKSCSKLLGRPWQFTANFVNSIADRPNILLPSELNTKAIIRTKNEQFQSNIKINQEIFIENLVINGIADIIAI